MARSSFTVREFRISEGGECHLIVIMHGSAQSPAEVSSKGAVLVGFA